jgi:ADP-ribose pyrophosphatase YjhB (NUDIX family)
MGLHFVRNIYDEHNYRAIQDIAMAMLALATETPMETMESLRAPIFARPTPLATGDAAVIDPDDDRMLLIRRADSGQWAMPGGALEVGETPAQGVVREVLEETGIRCEAVRLAGVFDSRLCGTTSRHHLYHFVFVCHPLNRGIAESALTPNEVLETAWFAADELPTEFYPGHAIRIAEAFRLWRGETRAYFDR